MQLTLIASILAFCATNVAANGSITFCKSANGGSCTTWGGFGRAPNCSGGCVPITGSKSVRQASADAGMCFTAYSDSSCSNNAKRIGSAFSNGDFAAFSYDCC